MSNRLLSSGLAALSFTVSTGLLAMALAPGIAHASTRANAVEVTVSGEQMVASKRVGTGDLDLTDAADLKRLDARIRGAISEVCDDAGNGRTSIAESRCRQQARRESDQQVAALRSEATALAAARSSTKIAVVAAR